MGAKNLDQLYSSIYASQTHIPKAHDKYYPLTPRYDNDKYTREDKDRCVDPADALILLMR